MARVVLGAVNQLPWFSLTNLHPHHPPRARSFWIRGAPPAGLEDSAVIWICSLLVPAVHTAGVHAGFL